MTGPTQHALLSGGSVLANPSIQKFGQKFILKNAGLLRFWPCLFQPLWMRGSLPFSGSVKLQVQLADIQIPLNKEV